MNCGHCENDIMGYSELTYNVPLYKLCELCCLDLCVGLDFCPIGEVISGYHNELSLAYSQG